MTVEPKEPAHIELAPGIKMRVEKQRDFSTLCFSTRDEAWLDAEPGDPCTYSWYGDTEAGGHAEVVQVVIVPDADDRPEARVTIRQT